MNRIIRSSLTIVTALLAAIAPVCSETPTPTRPHDRPNIIVIVADDLGYADMSAYDHAAADIRTPGLTAWRSAEPCLPRPT